MSDATQLIASVRALVARAAASPRDEDTLLEALAAIGALGTCFGGEAHRDDPSGTLVLEALWLSPRQARALADRGAAAIAAGPSSLGGDAELARAMAIRAASRGIDALLGQASSAAAVHSPARVPEATLLRLVRGELDGFRALEVAERARAHPRDSEALSLLLGSLLRGGDLGLVPAAEGAPRLRLAADGPAALRDPSAGKVVGKARSAAGVELEAVRFPDRVVAVYASAPISLSLEAALGPRTAGAKSRTDTRASESEGARTLGSAAGYLEIAGAGKRLVVSVDGERVELTLKR